MNSADYSVELVMFYQVELSTLMRPNQPFLYPINHLVVLAPCICASVFDGSIKQRAKFGYSFFLFRITLARLLHLWESDKDTVNI